MRRPARAATPARRPAPRWSSSSEPGAGGPGRGGATRLKPTRRRTRNEKTKRARRRGARLVRARAGTRRDETKRERGRDVVSCDEEVSREQRTERGWAGEKRLSGDAWKKKKGGGTQESQDGRTDGAGEGSFYRTVGDARSRMVLIFFWFSVSYI